VVSHLRARKKARRWGTEDWFHFLPALQSAGYRPNVVMQRIVLALGTLGEHSQCDAAQSEINEALEIAKHRL
jgi:hypothetical protein